MTAAVPELPEPLQRFEIDPAAHADLFAEVDSLLARYRADRDANRILPNAVEAVRVELTYHSNAIEGSTLSLRDTHLVIEGFEPNTGKTLREIYEARNHDRALRKVETWVKSNPLPAPLTERDLLLIHADVLADIDAAGAGQSRTGHFGELIPGLLAQANRPGVHPAIQAAELHYNLVAVHPFADGNGRTARLAMNYQLLRHGYPHTIVPVESRSDYLAALEEANAGRCAVFVLRCVRDSIVKLIGDGL